MFVLERNAEIISTVARNGNDIRVAPWRSVRETLDREEYRYGDRRFGMAEGLAMDAAHIYVVLDNNGNAREHDATDTRPMLFVFHRPPYCAN